MLSITRILGQQSQAEELINGLTGTDHCCARLTGPAGCGKSYVAGMVADMWTQRGGEVILAPGDDWSTSRSLCPLLSGLSWTKSDWSAVAKTGARSVVSIADASAGGLGIGPSIFDLLSSAARTRSERLLRAYSSPERDLILNIHRRARQRDILIIADDAQWWDVDSANLMRGILSPRLQAGLPELAAVHLLVVDTANADSEKGAIPLGRLQALCGSNIVIAEPIPRALLPLALQAFGLHAPLPVDIADAVYAGSNGHLKILEQLAASANRSVLPAGDEMRQTTWMLAVMQDRLRSLGESTPEVARLLTQAAILGLTVDEAELTCLSGQTAREVDTLLEFATDIGFIRRQQHRTSFSHEIIRSSILASQSVTKTRSILESLEKCLAVLRPHDYERRSSVAQGAGNIGAARELTALAGVARLRADHTVARVEAWLAGRGYSGDAPLTAYLRMMGQGYAGVAAGDFESPREFLQMPQQAESTKMACERIYLLALCLLEKQTISAADEAVELLSSWMPEVQDEIELNTRFLLLQEQAFVLANRFEDARKIDAVIERALTRRGGYDESATFSKHIQNRRSGSIQVPEVAVHRLDEAVAYFEGRTTSSHRGALECYRSLTNLSAIEIRLGRNDAAYAHAIRAAEVVAIDGGPFGRLDVLAHNHVLAALRSGVIGATEATHQQQIIVDGLRGTGEDFIQRCNLAAYQLLAENDEAAALTVASLGIELRENDLDETYLVFYWTALAVAVELLGGNVEEAQRIHSASDHFAQTVRWPCASYVRRRQGRVHEVLRSFDSTMSRPSFDELLISRSQEVGPAWSYYGRLIPCCELSFWSDS